jgi:hypothetical protein
MVETLDYLIQSNEFNITYHDERIGACKGDKGTLLYYNDKKIYVDFWDYASPTYSMEVANYGIDLILKLQQPVMSFDDFEKICVNRKAFLELSVDQRRAFHSKIHPWSFFPSKMMKPLIGKEDEIAALPIERHSFFCGKIWKCRGWMSKKLQQENIELVSSDQAFRNMEKMGKSEGKPLTDEEFLYKMRTSKYGLVLAGRRSHFTEAKNRREIDYMMLKKPLLLNFKPNYYNPMIEGKHYIYFDQNTSFKDLESMYNINEIAMNGYEWYKNNASKYGIVKTFLQIIRENL